MIRSTAALACLVFTLAACDRDDAAPIPQPVPAADVAPPAETAPDVIAPADAAPAAFDMRDYAGTFAAGDGRLELAADGTYRLDQGGTVLDGTWTVEQNDTRVRLDPNSKSDPDRVLAMDGRDRLAMLDNAGAPVGDAPVWTREPTAR
jgi:copper homeostasis protein (lipoprotein)